MPIDEALKFLAKNFREHLEKQRDRDTGDDEREIKFLLKLVIESRYISINEYDRLINHLRLKRDQLVSTSPVRHQRRMIPTSFGAIFVLISRMILQRTQAWEMFADQGRGWGFTAGFDVR